MGNQNAPLVSWIRNTSNRIQVLTEPATATDIVLLTRMDIIRRGIPRPRRFVCRAFLLVVPSILAIRCGGGSNRSPLEPTPPPNSGTLSVSLSNSAMTSLVKDLALIATLTEKGTLSATTIQWSQVSGPGSTSFKPGNALTTAVGFTHYGVYVLRVTVKNGDLSSSANVTVVVSNPPNLSIAGQVYEGHATVTGTLRQVIQQSPDIGTVRFNLSLPFVDTVRGRSAIVFSYRHSENQVGDVIFETQNVDAVSLTTSQQYSAFALNPAAVALMEAQAALLGSQHFQLL